MKCKKCGKAMVSKGYCRRCWIEIVQLERRAYSGGVPHFVTRAAAYTMDPSKFDFAWDPSGEYAEVIPVLWHDDASYAQYQGDCEDNDADYAAPDGDPRG